MSNSEDVDAAVRTAQKAFESWSKVNVKTRIMKLMKLHQLMTDNLDELAEMVVKETWQKYCGGKSEHYKRNGDTRGA